jgi:hypothetical protein
MVVLSIFRTFSESTLEAASILEVKGAVVGVKMKLTSLFYLKHVKKKD